ncbi:hypothetical protein BCR35DRAFT_298595 [Leucosporidium creatinivorum]|uniref:Zn(2)-C6 fungal-type domain-containing protein n=1 Tax=Leucosporidium creatinivorum TaxID=106004 RepID=A0A1Y2G4U3_9BASI|nr:hypothetical protein BCR35DRAFT_298595 [Leucosporidium creatinivorum]
MSKRSGSPLSPDDLQQADSAPFIYDLPSSSHLPSTPSASHAQSSNAYELPIPTSLEGLQAQVIALAQQSNVSGTTSDDVQVGSSKDLELEQFGQPAVDTTLDQQQEQQQVHGTSADVEVTQGANGKKKRKKAANPAGPRTSRACLACRKQKMRCEGADDPPCKRCTNQKLECVFERRTDYLLNPEDQAWQNKITTQLTTLTSTVQRLTSALEAHGIPIPPAPSTNGAHSATPPSVETAMDASVDAGVEQSVNVNVGSYANWATGDEQTGYTGN